MCLCDDFESGDDVQTMQSRPLVIPYCGNFSATHCTEVHVTASLESQGHKVIRLQEDAVSMKDIDAATWGADLFLWTHTAGFPKFTFDEMNAWLDAKRAIGLPTASYHLDLFAGLPRGENLATHPFWKTEYVFTPDGGSPQFFARHGVNHFYLRPGVYDAECVVGTPRKEFEADVIFVGSGSPHGAYHPEWGYRRELLAFLVKTYGRRFVKHGGPPIHGGRSFIRGADLSDLYATARVVVGDTLCLGPEDQREPRFGHQRYWCVDEDTEILTSDGWKRRADLRVGDTAYTIHPETGDGVWCAVSEIATFPAGPKEMVSIESRSHSSLTTVDHRWPVETKYTGLDPAKKRSRKRQFRKSGDLTAQDRIPIAAPCVNLPVEPTHSDALVELVAWAWTEGAITGGRYRTISQSRAVNMAYVERIRSALTAICGPAIPTLRESRFNGPAWAETQDGGARPEMSTFRLNEPMAALLDNLAPDHRPTAAFIRALTAEQLRLFVETSIDADGCRKTSSRDGYKPWTSITFAQKDPTRLDGFEMACALLGIATSRCFDGACWIVHLKRRGYINPIHAQECGSARVRRVAHDGVVWCPVTETGTWLARRKGTVYFTGNSDRVYETVGRGGYLVHPRIVGLEEEFTDGEHLRFYDYGDFDGLKAIIDAALADDAHRARVKAAGMAMVKGSCTYVHRTAEMIRLLAEHSSAIAEAVA